MTEKTTNLKYVFDFGKWIRDCEVPTSEIQNYNEKNLDNEIGGTLMTITNAILSFIDELLGPYSDKNKKIEGKNEIDFQKILGFARKLIPTGTLRIVIKCYPKAGLKKCIGNKQKRNIVWGGVYLDLKISATTGFIGADSNVNVEFNGWLIYERESCECHEKSTSMIYSPNFDYSIYVPKEHLIEILNKLDKDREFMRKNTVELDREFLSSFLVEIVTEPTDFIPQIEIRSTSEFPPIIFISNASFSKYF